MEEGKPVGALDDITVLDLGQVIGMPFCTMLLADMGARVIKVESREQGAERMALGIRRERNGKTERVHAAQYRDRNKLSVTLNLKQPAGARCARSCKKADVIARTSGRRRWRGRARIRDSSREPAVGYASITASAGGPSRSSDGYAMLAQAISGT